MCEDIHTHTYIYIHILVCIYIYIYIYEYVGMRICVLSHSLMWINVCRFACVRHFLCAPVCKYSIMYVMTSFHSYSMDILRMGQSQPVTA